MLLLAKDILDMGKSLLGTGVILLGFALTIYWTFKRRSDVDVTSIVGLFIGLSLLVTSMGVGCVIHSVTLMLRAIGG